MSLSKSISPTKIISKLYKSILGGKGGSTYYVKEKWEKEGRITITEEEWTYICQTQWTTTGSNIWREFFWKNTMRFLLHQPRKNIRVQEMPVGDVTKIETIISIYFGNVWLYKNIGWTFISICKTYLTLISSHPLLLCTWVK